MIVDLPALGKPTRPDVGQQLQLQAQLLRPRRACPGRRGAARGWWTRRNGRCRGRPGRRPRCGPSGRPRVRSAIWTGSPPSSGDLVDDRADRHVEREVLAVGAVHVRAHAVLAALGLELGVEPEVDQRVQVRAGRRRRPSRRRRRRRRSGRRAARTSRAGRRYSRGRRCRPPRGLRLRQRTSGSTVAQDALAAARRSWLPALSLLSLDATATSR